MRVGFETVSRGRFTGVVAGLAAMMTAGAAMAAPGQGGAMAACRGDVQSFCAGIEAGGGKKMRCLIENQSKLSAECNAVVMQRVETRAQRMGGVDVAQATPQAPTGQAAAPATGAPAAATPAPGVIAPKAAGKGGKGRMAACRTDVATFCATAEKGKGGRTKCLVENKAKLSPECAAVVDDQQQMKTGKKNVCATEAQTLCGEAKGPARRQCLEDNKAKMSADCAASLDKRAAKRAEKRGDAAAAPQSIPTPVQGAAPAPATPVQPK